MQQHDDRFHVQIDVSDHVVEMRATGEVDIATVGVLRSALWAAPARPLLRLDLSGVRLLSAAGVRALVAAHRRIRARGGVLVLADPTPTVARVLHVTGLHRVIPVRHGDSAAAPPAAIPGSSAPLVALAPRAASGPPAEPEPPVAPLIAYALGSLVPVPQPPAPALACA